jgi:hypothetical protein
MNEVLRRDFPLTRPEVGILLGNGTVGAQIWGRDNVLCISLNRSDFWLHRGGLIPGAAATHANIRAMAEQGNFAGLDGLLASPKSGRNGGTERPTLLPLGRIDLVFDRDITLKTGYLHLKNGKVVIDVADNRGAYQVNCHLSMEKPLMGIHLPANRDLPKIKCVTAWEYVADSLAALSLERPVMIEEASLSGWVQKRPQDPALCVAAASDKCDIYLALRYGDSVDEARDHVRKMFEKAKKAGSDAIRTQSATFWANHFRWVPHIDIPSETLSFLYYYGTYLFASLTTPGGVAPTIYGPWIDENCDPPFAGGYQAMINLRMCYWPAFRINLMHHCKPLFVMIDSWKDRLRENARRVFGIEDGILLPSMVDDRCTRIGGTWADLPDAGASCLIAELMYRYFLYTQDVDFLRNTAWPFMTGVMRVYEVMLEKHGAAYRMPFGISPAFRGTADSQWGKNPGFQLACINFLVDSLLAAAAILGEVPPAVWKEIQASLPKTALCETPGRHGAVRRELGIFDGVPLRESDALHSHLAGVSPFDTLDLDDPEVARALEHTVETWVSQGMGVWNAASLPWAGMIHTRLGNADMAELLLEIWERVFTNEGHSPVRDPIFLGFSTRGTPESVVAGKYEMLHLDAGMGATAAIPEMMVHTRRGVNYLFAGAPKRWKHVSFDNIRTEGAFEIGATRLSGRVTRVSIKANAAGTFRLSNPWGGRAALQRSRGTSAVQGTVLEISMAADERVELTGE